MFSWEYKKLKNQATNVKKKGPNHKTFELLQLATAEQKRKQQIPWKGLNSLTKFLSETNGFHDSKHQK